MRILYTTMLDSGNPFVDILGKRIHELDASIDQDFSRELFWGDAALDYDVVNIMWPEWLIDDTHNCETFLLQLSRIKQNGVKIVSTCHNLVPHYCNEEERMMAIRYAYENSDVILHLGHYSYEVLQKELPAIKHVIVPHHIYDDRYKPLPDRQTACENLGLNPKKKYALCFGAVRDKEECQLILDMARDLRFSEYKLLVPNGEKPYHRGPRRKIFHCLKYYYLKYFVYPNAIFCNNRFVSEETLMKYFAVSDVLVIHRLKILNSGNLPLGMYLGKTIVGPNVGNVGQILSETKNFVFDVKHIGNIGQIIIDAYKAHQTGKGRDNEKYAEENWGSKRVAQIILGTYRSIV